jgi:hypothetical protein
MWGFHEQAELHATGQRRETMARESAIWPGSAALLGLECSAGIGN